MFNYRGIYAKARPFGKPATTTLENFIDKLKKEPDLPSSVQVVSCCVYNKPKKLCSTCTATSHSRVIAGPIYLDVHLL